MKRSSEISRRASMAAISLATDCLPQPSRSSICFCFAAKRKMSPGSLIRSDEALKRNLAPRLDGSHQLGHRLLAPAFAFLDLLLLCRQAEDVAGKLDQI